MLILSGCRIELFETLILLLSLLLILEDLLLVGSDTRQNFPLLLEEVLLLLVKLLCLCDDLFFLLSETLVDLALLPLFLQKAHSLQRPGALYDKRSNPGQILITDLRLRVLTDVLVDTVEELVDFALLVDIHLFFSNF